MRKEQTPPYPREHTKMINYPQTQTVNSYNDFRTKNAKCTDVTKTSLCRKTLTCIQKAKRGPRVAHTPVHTFGHTGGGWQGAFQDSWWKAGALWLLEGADSGDICASCCSAIVETLKVNYNINDSTLQAVVPYYASIIPCMGTQRHREGIGPSLPPRPPPTSLWKGAVYERIVGLWSSTFSCYSTSPHGMVLTGWLIPSLSISIHHFIFRASTLPPLTPPPSRHCRCYFKQHLFDLAALYSWMKSIWERCHVWAEMIGHKNTMYWRTWTPCPLPHRLGDAWVQANTRSGRRMPDRHHTDISELSPIPRLSITSNPLKTWRIKAESITHSSPSSLQGNNSWRRKTKSGSHPLQQKSTNIPGGHGENTSFIIPAKTQ